MGKGKGKESETRVVPTSPNPPPVLEPHKDALPPLRISSLFVSTNPLSFFSLVSSRATLRLSHIQAKLKVICYDPSQCSFTCPKGRKSKAKCHCEITTTKYMKRLTKSHRSTGLYADTTNLHIDRIEDLWRECAAQPAVTASWHLLTLTLVQVLQGD